MTFPVFLFPSIRASISDHVRRIPQLQASAANTAWVVPSEQKKSLKPLTPTGNLKEFGTGDPKSSCSINQSLVYRAPERRGALVSCREGQGGGQPQHPHFDV